MTPTPGPDAKLLISLLTYFDYLKTTLGVDDPGVMKMARNSGLDWATTGTDLMSIESAKS